MSTNNAWENIENAESEFLVNLAENGGLDPLVAGMLRHCARLLAKPEPAGGNGGEDAWQPAFGGPAEARGDEAKNAARYQWLRQSGKAQTDIAYSYSGDEMDAAIDDEMRNESCPRSVGGLSVSKPRDHEAYHATPTERTPQRGDAAKAMRYALVALRDLGANEDGEAVVLLKAALASPGAAA